jgi:uncharacterized protein YdeI (YjbR/CyaY-like superfamily)
MGDSRPVFFTTQGDLHAWLEENHDKVSELWFGFYKKAAGKEGITYQQALDEALCFGWIDGVRKSLGDEMWMIRFTPRKPKSIWSQVNIKRATELKALGTMREPGLRAFEQRDETKTKLYSYEERTRGLDPVYEEKLKANPAAWEFFQSQPPSYRKPASWWVMSAKQKETRERRLATLIERSAQGLRLAQLIPSKKPTKGNPS